MISAIRSEDVEKWWPIVEPFIEKALSKTTNEFDKDDIYWDIFEAKTLLLLVSIDDKIVGAITATMNAYPLKKVFTILTVSGENLDNWIKEAFTNLEILAKKMGANTIQGHGRRGWVKKMEPLGMKELYTTVEKVL